LTICYTLSRAFFNDYGDIGNENLFELCPKKYLEREIETLEESLQHMLSAKCPILKEYQSVKKSIDKLKKLLSNHNKRQCWSKSK